MFLRQSVLFYTGLKRILVFSFSFSSSEPGHLSKAILTHFCMCKHLFYVHVVDVLFYFSCLNNLYVVTVEFLSHPTRTVAKSLQLSTQALFLFVQLFFKAHWFCYSFRALRVKSFSLCQSSHPKRPGDLQMPC